MGMLKRMKDLKDVVNAAPGMVAQSQQLAAHAQQMALAQQAAAQAQLARAQQPGQFGQFGGLPSARPAAAFDQGPAGPDFDPIAGVSLAEFAAMSKGVAACNYDAAQLPAIAESRGIPAVVWAEAAGGWNARIQATAAVAQRFNQLYRES